MLKGAAAAMAAAAGAVLVWYQVRAENEQVKFDKAEVLGTCDLLRNKVCTLTYSSPPTVHWIRTVRSVLIGSPLAPPYALPIR